MKKLTLTLREKIIVFMATRDALIQSGPLALKIIQKFGSLDEQMLISSMCGNNIGHLEECPECAGLILEPGEGITTIIQAIESGLERCQAEDHGCEGLKQ